MPPALLLALAIAAGEPPRDRHLALGASLLDEHGFGVVARARGTHAGLEAAAGLAPQLLLRSPECGASRVVASGRLTASALAFFGDAAGAIEHGLRLGLSQDGRHGLGGVAGYQGEVRLGERLSLQVGFGLRFEPEGARRERASLLEDCGASSTAPGLTLLSTLAPYTGGSLLLYLF